ncbi:hypothetical protein WJX73_002319 [Symbiochloris irregularis]|uniref:Fungal lipase-type domain-containing protein n=1 Tax=Symbiochloris irregularis TaxID=706552 RepID=A0AAW1PZK1_9CHLO
MAPPKQADAVEGSSATRAGTEPSIIDDRAGYCYATAEVAAANSTQPWNVASAFANETLGFLRDKLYDLAGASDSQREQPDKDAQPVYHESPALMRNELQSNLPHSEADPHLQPQAGLQGEQYSLPKPMADEDDVMFEGDGKQAAHDRTSSSFTEATGQGSPSQSSIDMQEVAGTSKRDVVLRLEFMTAGQARFVILFMWSALLVAMFFLWLEFSLKITDPNGSSHSRDQQIINLVVGGVCFLVMSVSIWRFVTRVTLAHMYNLVWKSRRLRSTALNHFELFVQYANIIVFLIANGHSEASWCNFFSEWLPWTQLVAWTFWNLIFLMHAISARNVNIWRKRATGSTLAPGADLQSGSQVTQSHPADDKGRTSVDPALYLEAPIWVHWPLGILWVLSEVAVVADCWHYASGSGNNVNSGIRRPAGVPLGDCKNYVYDCSITRLQIGLVGLMLAFPVFYFVIFCIYLRQAFVHLKDQPYSDFKIGNLIVRLMVRIRLAVFSFFILSIVLLYFVKYKSCRVFSDTWLGLTPLHIAESASVVCWSFVAMPKSARGKPPLLQAWLQEFAWTERELPKVMARRNAAQSSGSQERAQELRQELEQMPMFCFQTAMHMWYWSALVYDYKQAESSTLSLEEGMSFYGLTSSELFWERASDTKMLMAWNRNTVVVAFRGTASINNAWSDLQAYPTLHLPKRGNCFARPKVHKGFQKCWRRNNFHETVKARIVEMLKSGELEEGHVKFYVTGHSLGGALATLAAFSFATGAEEAGYKDSATGGPLPIACYTFGAPRTGNHTFAREYEGLVPDTWHIINDQDAVPRSGKFMFIFKRGGQRVIINRLGDMIVRPLSIEASLRQVPGGLSVSQHLLAAYTVSLVAVLVGQFSNKRFRGGMGGVVRLAEQCPLVQRLIEESVGWTLEDMRHMLRWGPSHAKKVKARLSKTSSTDQSATGLGRLSAALSGLLKKESKKDGAASSDEEKGMGDMKGSVLDPEAADAQAPQIATAQAAQLQP